MSILSLLKVFPGGAQSGWMKEELKLDFHINGENVKKEVDDYIAFFNERRPAYSLNYLTPKEYKSIYYSN